MSRNELKPLPAPRKPRTPAPAWVALVAAWLGLLSVVVAIVIPFLPGSKDPVAELQHAAPYSPADRVLAVGIYLSPAAIFMGIVVMWQMRDERRPLPEAMVAQRVQAWAGIVLGIVGAGIIYAWVALRGPS